MFKPLHLFTLAALVCAGCFSAEDFDICDRDEECGSIHYRCVDHMCERKLDAAIDDGLRLDTGINLRDSSVQEPDADIGGAVILRGEQGGMNNYSGRDVILENVTVTPGNYFAVNAMNIEIRGVLNADGAGYSGGGGGGGGAAQGNYQGGKGGEPHHKSKGGLLTDAQAGIDGNSSVPNTGGNGGKGGNGGGSDGVCGGGAYFDETFNNGQNGSDACSQVHECNISPYTRTYGNGGGGGSGGKGSTCAGTGGGAGGSGGGLVILVASNKMVFADGAKIFARGLPGSAIIDTNECYNGNGLDGITDPNDRVKGTPNSRGGKGGAGAGGYVRVLAQSFEYDERSLIDVSDGNGTKEQGGQIWVATPLNEPIPGTSDLHLRGQKRQCRTADEFAGIQSRD